MDEVLHSPAPVRPAIRAPAQDDGYLNQRSLPPPAANVSSLIHSRPAAALPRGARSSPRNFQLSAIAENHLYEHVPDTRPRSSNVSQVGGELIGIGARTKIFKCKGKGKWVKQD